jgi:iron complex transport system ATP-binding protein
VKIRIQDLDAGYQARLVLRQLQLEVQHGEIIALVGPNGSGKSTLLRALGRILRPKSGTILLDGRSISRLSTRDVARELAILPQGPSLSNDMTVEELIWMGRSPHQGVFGIPNLGDHEAVRWAIEETGVGDMTGRSMASLSGGERQRVWIAMALAQQPKVLLLDEPTTFLDLNHQLEVLDLVRYLNQVHHITVVMVLHDLNQAARYAHRIVVLKEGRISAEGTPAEVLTAATLRDVFSVEASIVGGPDGVAMVIVPLSRVVGNPHEEETEAAKAPRIDVSPLTEKAAGT